MTFNLTGVKGWQLTEACVASLAIVATTTTIVSQTIDCEPYPARGVAYEAVVYPGELYDQTYSEIRTIPAALKQVENNETISGKGAEYDRLTAIEDVVSRRFIHGYSQSTFCDNWVGNLLGHLRWDVRSPVDPDKIMKFSWAGCSQQSLVVQELARLSGLEYLSVRQPSHYSSALKAGGQWYLVDPDQPEPDMAPPPLLRDGMTPAFGHLMDIVNGEIALTHMNAFPASRGWLFQEVTHLLSRFGFLSVLTIWGCLRWRSKSKSSDGRSAVFSTTA